MAMANGTEAQPRSAASASGDASVQRRVAVLICGIPPPAVLQTQGDYGAQFSKLLQQKSHQDEDWSFWRAYEGELPTAEELVDFDAIVFTGGHTAVRCSADLHPQD